MPQEIRSRPKSANFAHPPNRRFRSDDRVSRDAQHHPTPPAVFELYYDI
jgi:hypothetical protein